MSFEEYLNNIQNTSIENIKQCGLGVRQYFWEEYRFYLMTHGLQEV